MAVPILQCLVNPQAALQHRLLCHKSTAGDKDSGAANTSRDRERQVSTEQSMLGLRLPASAPERGGTRKAAARGPREVLAGREHRGLPTHKPG